MLIKKGEPRLNDVVRELVRSAPIPCSILKVEMPYIWIKCVLRVMIILRYHFKK